jgi:hypothetical protein
VVVPPILITAATLILRQTMRITTVVERLARIAVEEGISESDAAF